MGVRGSASCMHAYIHMSCSGGQGGSGGLDSHFIFNSHKFDKKYGVLYCRRWGFTYLIVKTFPSREGGLNSDT